MTSQEIGAKFEQNAKNFFVWLFEEIGFTVVKNRVQFSGTQDGFDIHLIATINNFERQIHIECKDYKNDLEIGNILKKAWDLEKNYSLTENDLFIAISPRANFKNSDNSEKASPFLNEKFSFKSYFIDNTNGVTQLFALNDECYKEIYKKDIDFVFDRKEQLKKFRDIIFSRKPFKKIYLTEKNRNNFIGEIKSNTNYIPRYLTNNFNNNELSFFKILNLNLQSLKDILEVENKVLLLGNPGLGKSTELKEFAISKWKIGEQDSFVPIFRNLKNFTISNEIVDFLPTNFNDITSCYIIFDGIDEIKDAQDFISKLEVFIEECKIKEQKTIKFILSCRTNIYESIIKSISDFKVFYLNNLSNEDAFSLLKKQLHDTSVIGKMVFKSIHYDFLKNPFLVEILSDYINRNKSLPNDSIQLWGNYIDKRLEFDNKNKLLKLNINTFLILKYSKDISLISELMKVNSIKESDIFQLISEHTQEYLKNPLIEKDLNNNSWNFEHRNIQEFFAARYLSELSYQNIINFISISENKKGDNKIISFIKKFFKIDKSLIYRTHPSLFNTITFLLNILDNSKREQIIKWLEKNNPEILFTADSDRINMDVRKIVFQNYFRKTCIENTFWISYNRSFSPESIAKFGDCEDNFNYLVSIIQNANNHFRVIISALDLLVFMNLPKSNNGKFQTLLILKLKSENIDSTNSKENDLKIKTYIITCIQKFNFHKENQQYLSEIIHFFRDEDTKEINNSILYLISSIEGDIDNYFDFILDEFLRVFKIKKRSKTDNYISSKIIIEDLILRINNFDNFLKILKYLFNEDDSYFIRFDDSFTVQVFEKCRVIASNDISFIDKIFELIQKKKHWDLRENELVNLLKSTNSSMKVIEKVINNEITLTDSKYLVARLVSSDNINLLIEKFVREKTEKNEVEIFRNIIGNTNDRNLALSFEKIMVENGYIFSEKYLSNEDIEKMNLNQIIKKQDNFDILFSLDKIEFELKNIFEDIKKEQVDWDLICKYKSAWYNKNGHFLELDSALALLSNLIRDYGPLTFQNALNLINEENVVMSEVRRHLSKNNELIVSSSQEEVIFRWCKESVDKINYDKIILVEKNYNHMFSDYYVCKNIYVFQKKFNFELPQKFYIKTLIYCDFDSFSNEENQFNYVIKKIDNKDILDKLIVDNINSAKFITLRSHITYALENNLINSFERIKEFFFSDLYLSYQNNTLEKFFEQTNDVEFIKLCCLDISTILCWEALKILMKYDLEKEFIIEIAKNYLNLNEDNHRMEALGILFKNNLPEAMEIFFDYVKDNLGDSIKLEYYSGYSNESGLKLIERFYNLLYEQNENDDVFKYHHAKELFRHYLNVMSGRNDLTFNHIQNIFKRIKSKIKKEGKDLFFINMLIEDSINSYVNYKSKPLSFNEAKAKIISFQNSQSY
jgi:hypothetical protein